MISTDLEVEFIKEVPAQAVVGPQDVVHLHQQDTERDDFYNKIGIWDPYGIL